MIKLKPCPFCGGEAEVGTHGNHRQSTIISCGECGVTHESGDEGEMVGTSWNSRETDEQLAKANKRVKELEASIIKFRQGVTHYNRSRGDMNLLLTAYVDSEKLRKGGES